MVKGFMRKSAQCDEGFYAWKTPSNHRVLWKTSIYRPLERFESRDRSLGGGRECPPASGGYSAS